MSVFSACFAIALASATADEGASFQIHGAGWTDIGRIMHVSDTLINGADPTPTLDITGNILQSLGAQFTLVGDIGEHFEAALGYGTVKVNHAQGKGGYSYLAISLFQNFITQSRLTYYTGEKSAPLFSATIGSFPFIYNKDVKNLGAYLFRGPVYPGLLMGGFADPATDSTRSTMLGLNLHSSLGNLSQDILLNAERDIPPTLDWSVGYVAKYKAFGALEVGAGVNFYRAVPYKNKLMAPGHLSEGELSFKKDMYIEVDTVTHDTVFFTHQGTKVMGMFSLDFKPIFGIESKSADDMKLYGEAAIIGLKNYGKTYGDIKQRIPVMLGFNIPTFGLLDHVSLEVEHYGALYRNDLARVGNNNVVADWTVQDKPIPSPKPVSARDYGITPEGLYINSQKDTINVKGTAMDMDNLTTDDWKWSVLVDKTVSRHVKFTAQVANDHYRPRPIATGLIFSNGGTAEAFGSPSDWYFIFRAGYFF
jgi:hypothetical protein